MSTIYPGYEESDGFEPPVGAQAFEQNHRDAVASRAAQLLAMSTYAFGSRDQAIDIRDDADALRVPFVAPLEDGETLTPRYLDRLTSFTRRSIDSDLKYQRPESALWWQLARDHSPQSLLALLNDSLHSDESLERVAAAAALHFAPRGAGLYTEGILAEGVNDEDPHAAAIASAALGEFGEGERVGRETETQGAYVRSEASLTVHGTWGRIGPTRWYVPGSSLFELLRGVEPQDLYDDPDYFRWSGGYSQIERDMATADLLKWKERRAIDDLSVVYAHSHGGNVALSTAAAGEHVHLLVLLHTPALRRPDEEWKRIRANVDRVVVMRTRLDWVVMVDGLRTGSTQKFDLRKLPHTTVGPSFTDPTSWFSHSYYTQVETWNRFNLAGEIAFEHGMSM